MNGRIGIWPPKTTVSVGSVRVVAFIRELLAVGGSRSRSPR